MTYTLTFLEVEPGRTFRIGVDDANHLPKVIAMFLGSGCVLTGFEIGGEEK